MNKTDHSSLTKTCSVCSLQKPIAAFLQFGGADGGGSYGNICASCRKEQAENARKQKADESGTTTRTTRTIDANARIESEAEKRKDQKEESEQYYEEREEKDVKKAEKIEQTQHIEKAEKKHRESFLDRPFNHAKKETITKSAAAQAAEAGMKQAITNSEITRKENVIKSDIAAKDTFTQSTNITVGMDLTEKFKTGSFREFLTRVGGNSPVAREIQRKANELSKAAREKPAGAGSGAAKSADAGSADTLSDRIEKTWGPSRKR